MKKLLFIINTLGFGGAERAMLNLFGALSADEYEISLFVLTEQGELCRELPENVRLINKNYKDESVLTKKGRKLLMMSVLKAGIGKGLFIRRAPYLIKNFLIMRKKGKILPDKLLWKLLADGAPEIKEEYDLAVAYLEGGSTYYAAEHVNAKKKAAFVHIDYTKAGYSRELDLDCYEKFDRIFTVSDEVREHFLKVYPEYENKTYVFNNLLNKKKIIKMSEDGVGFDDGFEGIRILTVGRLTRQKRYDIAIEAMKLLKDKCDIPIRWYALGEGELRDTLNQQIISSGLENDFILLGVRQNPYPLYKECDFYVHATEFEGKSIAVQEAQILGKPILATDCSGNREQIENGVDGLLCRLDSESVCDRLLDMIRHPEMCKSYGEKSKQKVLCNIKGLEEFLALIS
jgi:glycosyltransferase involved in cell wall biosynthesis